MEILRELRKEKGISQADLGKILGVSGSQVGMMEQGRREPSIKILVALSEYFEVPVDYLLKAKLDDSAPYPNHLNNQDDIFNFLLYDKPALKDIIKNTRAISRTTFIRDGKEIRITHTKRKLFYATMEMILDVR